MCVCKFHPREARYFISEIGFLKNCKMWVESPQSSNSRKKRNILIALFVNLSAFIKYKFLT